MPNTLTGASGCSSIGSARSVNAWCALCQDSPHAVAAPETGTPSSPIRCAARSRVRLVSRARAGIWGIDSVKVCRGQSGFSQRQRRLTHTIT